MAYLRHATRHLQHTVELHLGAALDALDWTAADPDDVPFGTSKVEYVTRRIDDAELRAITGNMVAISFGTEPPDEPLQLGGGLARIEHVMFVDIVAVSDAIGLALAGDIRDLLSGVAPDSSPFLKVRDFTDEDEGEEVPSYQLEFVNVARRRPDTVEWKRFWQVVDATIELTYPGSGDD